MKEQKTIVGKEDEHMQKNEIKPAETKDIFEERSRIKELANQILPPKVQESWTREQADHALEKRLEGLSEPEIKALEHPGFREMDVSEGVRPLENYYAQEWEKINEPREIAKDIYACNPNFRQGKAWQINCQRCVPAFEMRRRGYDVTAMPKFDDGSFFDISYQPFSVWKDPQVILCRGDGVMDIKNIMRQWGDGARVQIAVDWNVPSGHTFIAEQVNGETRFYDPQTGSLDASEYFKYVKPGSVRMCRIDQLDVTSRILECCKKA